MRVIKHRINALDAVAGLGKEFGAEIDVRYHHNELVLHHDPFGHHECSDLLTLDQFCSRYQSDGPLILNIKTEGIESACIEVMKSHNISNWFFLDLSMPYFVKYAKLAASGSLSAFGPSNLAVRFSEHEAIDYCLAFATQAQWLWVDYFTQCPLTDAVYQRLAPHFNICLVSPELQGHDLSEIAKLRDFLGDKTIQAVCTKVPELWQ